MNRRVLTCLAVAAAGALLAPVTLGRMSAAAPSAAQPSTIDLSLYVRVGRFDLPEPTRTPAPPGSVLAQEVSAVTYNWDTDTLFVVGDGGTSIVQVTKAGGLIDSMTLAPGSSPQGTDFFDPEGLTYVGGGRFVMVEERDRQAVLFTYVARATLSRSGAQTVKLGTFAPNIGIEGISYDPATGGFIAVKESTPQGIFQTAIDFVAGTATNGSPTTENAVDLFDPALLNLLDLADVFALSTLPPLAGAESTHLLVLSQESGKVLHVDRAGVIYNSLTIQSDPGNPLTVAAQQHEGLTMDRDGNLYIVSENGGGDFDHPQLWVYAPSTVPNQPPSRVSLTNQTNTLPENTSTAISLKVADIAVTDDGLGTNLLAVSGLDASVFEVDASGLYIKAGTTLDFEAKSSYVVTLAVDDPTVGSSPDASTSFTLTLTDVVNETPSGAAIVVSEIAPWSSGNSPVGADWFEVTNTGTTAVNVAGWKMDDSSNAFASAVALNGVTTIAPGESVIFIETADLAAATTSFITTWFGGLAPAGLQIGSYSGGGVGLSTGGDGVTVYDASGTVRASVSFGASPAVAPFGTFDNAAGLNNATVTLLSSPGVNGAFVALGDLAEAGSPGRIAGGPPAPADRLRITEVAPWSSGNSPVSADWFEVTNTGSSAVDLTGWKIDDNSESPAAAVALSGVGSIAPGESVIFIETSSLSAAAAAFRGTWFGAHAPAGLQIGSYSGAGVGLGTGGDAVNLYNGSGILRARVFFGASPAGPSFATFDNAAGLNGAALTQLSVAGVNGAFVAAADANEIGSPGRIAAPVRVVITEVTPWGSGNAPYAADWFELTNTGSEPVDLAGWKMDDSSNAFATAVALRGVATLPPGASAVFLESAADGSLDAALIESFALAWTGLPSLPEGVLVGAYGGAGVGLSTGGDAVNIFDASGRRITGVAFGASTTGVTFDNAAALGSAVLPLPAISTLSTPGITGAFVAADGIEVGSPAGTGVDVDQDGDGVSSPLEVGSAGTPSGNRLGSNPLHALSTPEVCDGADNDLNEGIDEGFPDTDADGAKDCVDGDDDGDGIADIVDPQPLAATNQTFSDITPALDGATAGTILARSGKGVAIDDVAPNPAQGVAVIVSGAGAGDVRIRLDGKSAIIALPNGSYVITDPINTTTVAVESGGPARIAMTLAGLPVAIVVGGGSSITFTETTANDGSLAGLVIDAVAGTVTLNGVRLEGPLPLVGPPQAADACTAGRWQTFNFPAAFKNQGDCVSYVVTRRRNEPAGR